MSTGGWESVILQIVLRLNVQIQKDIRAKKGGESSDKDQELESIKMSCCSEVVWGQHFFFGDYYSHDYSYLHGAEILARLCFHFQRASLLVFVVGFEIQQIAPTLRGLASEIPTSSN